MVCNNEMLLIEIKWYEVWKIYFLNVICWYIYLIVGIGWNFFSNK